MLMPKLEENMCKIDGKNMLSPKKYDCKIREFSWIFFKKSLPFVNLHEIPEVLATLAELCISPLGSCRPWNIIVPAGDARKQRNHCIATFFFAIGLQNEFNRIQWFFPTCQVRVVRFYVSLSFSSSFSSSSFSSSSSSSPPLLLSCAGPQRRSCVCSVPRRASTAILCVQCSAPDLNCDPVSAVFRAGPQPRSCECRVPRRTSTAILWAQCSAPDLNREMCQKRYGRKNVKRYVRKNVVKICQRECQKMCQRECQKMCQRECQKVCQKECQKICLKEVQKECQRKDVRKNVRRNGENSK